MQRKIRAGTQQKGVINLNASFIPLMTLYAYAESAAQGASQSSIRPVSAESFSNALVSIVSTFYATLSPIILPAAKLGLLISALVLLIGSICMSKTLKRVAWGGIVTTVVVLFLYYLGPAIFGYIVTVLKTGEQAVH